jgi:hypothetical protein
MASRSIRKGTSGRVTVMVSMFVFLDERDVLFTTDVISVITGNAGLESRRNPPWQNILEYNFGQFHIRR